MNNYFEGNDKSRHELRQEREENQVYKKIEQEILDSNYRLNDKVRTLIAAYAIETGEDADAVTLAFLEHFNREQGALLDELGEEYVRLLFSVDNIRKRMIVGKNFHEAVAALAGDAREKGMNLDKGAIDKEVKTAENILKTDTIKVA